MHEPGPQSISRKEREAPKTTSDGIWTGRMFAIQVRHQRHIGSELSPIIVHKGSACARPVLATRSNSERRTDHGVRC